MLAHSDLHFLGSSARIKADCPFSICKVGFDATVWSPRIAMKLGVSIRYIAPFAHSVVCLSFLLGSRKSESLLT